MLIRRVARENLFDFATSDGQIHGGDVMSKVDGSNRVTIIVPACDEIEEGGVRRNGIPVLRDGLHFSRDDGFKAVEIVSEAVRSRLGVVGPYGLRFTGIPPIIRGLDLSCLDWGGGPVQEGIRLERSANDESTNAHGTPTIDNTHVYGYEPDMVRFAVVNSGQEMMTVTGCQFRSDNGVALLLDTDIGGPGSTMSGWTLQNTSLLSYGTGTPFFIRGCATNGAMSNNCWINTEKVRKLGDTRPLVEHAVRIMDGVRKSVSLGIPRYMSFDFTPEGNAKKIAEWNVGASITVGSMAYAMGVRELTLTTAPPSPA